jgi:hypothetical protein
MPREDVGVVSRLGYCPTTSMVREAIRSSWSQRARNAALAGCTELCLS